MMTWLQTQMLRKRKRMRAVIDRIAQTQLQSGYPYLCLKIMLKIVHPNSNIGQIKKRNLCNQNFPTTRNFNY
ncbi:hypothetical protein ACV56Z_07240 [Staphylococcus aureus]